MKNLLTKVIGGMLLAGSLYGCSSVVKNRELEEKTYVSNVDLTTHDEDYGKSFYVQRDVVSDDKGYSEKLLVTPLPEGNGAVRLYANLDNKIKSASQRVLNAKTADEYIEASLEETLYLILKQDTDEKINYEKKYDMTSMRIKDLALIIGKKNYIENELKNNHPVERISGLVSFKNTCLAYEKLQKKAEELFKTSYNSIKGTSSSLTAIELALGGYNCQD